MNYFSRFSIAEIEQDNCSVGFEMSGFASILRTSESMIGPVGPQWGVPLGGTAGMSSYRFSGAEEGKKLLLTHLSGRMKCRIILF